MKGLCMTEIIVPDNYYENFLIDQIEDREVSRHICSDCLMDVDSMSPHEHTLIHKELKI